MNNEVRSSLSGLMLGGFNRRWMILDNEFVVKRLAGLQFARASDDHLVIGNTITLAQPWQPALRLRDADCLGIFAINNQVKGTERSLGGRAAPQVLIEAETETAETGFVVP
jgi:hypothetical protein